VPPLVRVTAAGFAVGFLFTLRLAVCVFAVHCGITPGGDSLDDYPPVPEVGAVNSLHHSAKRSCFALPPKNPETPSKLFVRFQVPRRLPK
jgi:hypothetical protein